MIDYLCRNPTASKWRLLHEAARGLLFLHKKQVVHGDLKLNNILIMADGKAKLADFGLSRRKETLTATKLYEGGVGAGAIRWRAPECFRTKPIFSSDIYSFAMCIYETVSGLIPYEDVPTCEAEKMICSGQLPSRVECISDRVWDLIVKMTHAEPACRMSLRSVINELGELKREEVVNGSSTDIGPSAVEPPGPAHGEVGSSERVKLTQLDAFDSVEAAVLALRQHMDRGLQDKALEWLWRESLVTLDTPRELYEFGGAPILKRIIEDPDTPYLHKLYALDELKSIGISIGSGALSADVDQLKTTLHRPDESEVASLYIQIADEKLPVNARTKAIEAVSVVMKFALFDGNTDRIVEELTRLLQANDLPVEATDIARALGNIACGSPVHRVAIVNARAVGPLVQLLTSTSDKSKANAAKALGIIAQDSPDTQIAIVNAGAVGLLVQLFASGSAEVKSRSSRALFSLGNG